MPTAKPPTLPTELKIGTVTYTVIDDPERWAAQEDADQAAHGWGTTHHVPAQILINPDLADGHKRQTLWHEVMHALILTVGGDPTWKLKGSPDVRQESIIRALEHPTLAVLRDNPDLVAYLTA